ncbi:DoxX family protein [Pengzhenrongella sp.]|jgi:thiosulfate dehydrogenase [quinone] large subunit|uniref:DoxX family protein n=1 Tax=Pengzhenrongella sp. TaxID=2888820 RepID=UPI002F935C21
MSTTHPPDRRTARPTTLIEDDLVTSARGRHWLAVTRLAIGFTFLWPFLDKTFGLHYSTGAPTLSWLDGGTPSQGYLTSLTRGPFKDFFANIAGPVTDWLFMLTLLGLGLALILGIGLRVSAVVGPILMLLMWAAEWPFSQGSTNPVIDYHLIYALVVIVCAVLLAGDTWGLGRRWAALGVVQRQPWLR